DLLAHRAAAAGDGLYFVVVLVRLVGEALGLRRRRGGSARCDLLELIDLRFRFLAAALLLVAGGLIGQLGHLLLCALDGRGAGRFTITRRSSPAAKSGTRTQPSCAS